MRDGAVQEGTHSNLFAVSGDLILTPPLTSFVLPGITWEAIMELCGALGLGWQERAIPVDSLLRANEVMIVGTTVEITPVIQIEDKPIGRGRHGPVTRLLQTAFNALTAAGSASNNAAR